MLSLFETVSAVEFGIQKGVFNIDRRGDYRDILFALMSKGGEYGEEKEALEEARRILSQSKGYKADSFETDVASFDPNKAGCGRLITAAKEAGWVKPKISEEQKQEKYRNQYDEADPKKPSPYFVEHKGYWNPYGAVVRDDGTTLVHLLNFDGEHVAFWGVYQQGEEWKKTMLTKVNDGFWLNTYPDGHVNGTSYFLEQPVATEHEPAWRTTRVILTEAIAKCQAIEMALRNEGRGYLLDSRELMLASSMSCGQMARVFNGMKERRHDLDITLVVDREESGAGIHAAADICKAHPDTKIVDPGQGAPGVEIDIDDFLRQHGSAATVELLDAARPMTPEEIEEALGVAVAKRGRGRPRKIEGEVIPTPKKPAAASYTAILDVLTQSGIGLRFDEFTRRMMVRQDDQPPVELNADALFDLTCLCELAGLGGVRMGDVEVAVKRLGSANRYDSAREWLDGVKWDGVPRVDRFFFDYCEVPEGQPRTHQGLKHEEGDDTRATAEYARAIARYMFTAMAGRVLQPGVKADMTPVLLGGQGAGKSRLIQALAPWPEAFTTLDFAVSDAENVRKLVGGKLVVELDELRGLATRSGEHIKSFLSQQADDHRELFAKFYDRIPRRFLTFGTSNDFQFLRDPTGSRRFLPIAVGQCDPERVQRDCLQLWAEGAELFRQHGILFADAERLAQYEHDKFEHRDGWHSEIAEWCEGKPHVTTTDAAVEALKLEIGQVTDGVQKRISGIFQILGYKNSRRRIDGKRVYGYFLEACP